MGLRSYVAPWLQGTEEPKTLAGSQRQQEQQQSPRQPQQQQNRPQRPDSADQSISARQHSVHKQPRRQQSAGRAVSSRLLPRLSHQLKHAFLTAPRHRPIARLRPDVHQLNAQHAVPDVAWQRIEATCALCCVCLGHIKQGAFAGEAQFCLDRFDRTTHRQAPLRLWAYTLIES